MSKDPIELVGQINATMEQMKKDNAEVSAALKTATESAGTDAKAAIKKAEELAVKLEKASNSIIDMEQKLAENIHRGKAAPQTLGEIVIKSDAFKQFASGNSQKFRIEANVIIGQEGSPPANSDTLVTPQYLPGIIPGAFRSLKIRDVLPSGVTGSNLLKYTRETTSGFTNNAAETAESAAKPQSGLVFELVNAPVATIAHFIKASKQVLEDSSALESYINVRMRYGVDVRYDLQLLKGNGAGQNIAGMTKSTNSTAFTPLTGDNQLDTISRMIQKVEESDYQATAILLSPTDWHAIQRIKRVSGDTAYTVGDPATALSPMLWGKPVVVTNQMTAGNCLVGALDIAYQVFNRQGTVVEMFEQDDTNVQENLLTIRAECRGVLASYRPESVQYGLLSL